MRKVKKEDILINPDQIPQGRKIDIKIASVIVNKTQNEQEDILGKKDLSGMDWHKQITI